MGGGNQLGNSWLRKGIDVHGRSGRVALPRVKIVPARRAWLVAVDDSARRAERAAEVRRITDDMLGELVS